MASPEKVARVGRRTAHGRYEIKEQLAVGGMGIIYRAYDRVAEREVAYKRLRLMEESTRARVTALFQGEYERLLQLQHPNIVEVYDFGEDGNGAAYYTMELLTGEDLTRTGVLPYRDACRVLRDIASALALVHARRLVHRDVSPNNVRLTSDGRAKLIDFGALTPFGIPRELVGTPACIAPECLTRTALDQRSDLYSLGAVAYWSLTRRTSVRARSLDELLAYGWGPPPLAPSELVPAIPKELDELVLSLLAQDPTHRPPSAAHVIERLTSIAELPPEEDERRVAFSYLARPPLCGRDAESARSAELLQKVQEREGCAVLIEGNAGVGRSALLDGIATQAQLAGVAVLRVSGEPGARPFALSHKLVDAGTALYPELDITLLRMRHGSIHAPGDTPQNIPSAVDVAATHATLLSAAEGLLLDIARQEPLVLIVDDLQTSDPESLALFASLARTAKTSGVALFASTVSGQRTQNPSALALLEGTAQRWPLPPLAEEHVVQLVAAMFGDVPNSARLASWLHAQSAGNAATALDLARLLLQRDIVRYSRGTFILPHVVDLDLTRENLAGTMLARLGELSEVAEKVAGLLSLHEGSITVEQLARASELPLREVQLAIDELTTRGVIAKSEAGFALPASSLRRALQEQYGELERRTLHHRLARALLADAGPNTVERIEAVKHLLDAGEENEAVESMLGMPVLDVMGNGNSHCVPLLEELLALYRRQGRTRLQRLALLLPIVSSGYFYDLGVQKRYVDETLQGLSEECGISVARRLRPMIGGKLALGIGLLWAAVRRVCAPKRDRLGTLTWMLHAFIGMVSNAVAAAATSLDSASVQRFNAHLVPFDVLPKGSAGYIMREFCLATGDFSAGRFSSALARYRELIPLLAEPIETLHDYVRLQLHQGCLNGSAQALVQAGDAAVLELADRLGRGDAFFAPHAEVVRAAYFGERGEQERFEVHRARAERLALRGGTSWTAIVPLVVYQAYAAMMTYDAVRLEGAIAELHRLRTTAPRLQTVEAIARAWLEHLRGRSDTAIDMMRDALEAPAGRQLLMWRVNEALYASLLNAGGQYGAARDVAQRLIAQLTGDELYQDQGRSIVIQLAQAEAGLGEIERARTRIAEHLRKIEPYDNGAELGEAHRAGALIALMAADEQGFEQHFIAMQRSFAATRNPTLLAHVESVRARARKAGLRAHAMLTSSGALAEMEFDASTTVEAFPADRTPADGLPTAGRPDNDVEPHRGDGSRS